MGKSTLSFVGDVFLAGDYATLSDAAKRSVFDALAPRLRHSDIAFGNFEGVVLDREPAGLRPDKIRMPVHPVYLDALRAAGFNVLSLSNNHAFDYGLDALRATRQALQAAGFTTFGAGDHLADAAGLAVHTVGDLAVGFIGFTCESTHPGAVAGATAGVAAIQSPDLVARVAAARRQCDLLVVSLHWGDEHVAWPSPHQLALARRLVDAGAHVIAGHHAHVFQGCERYRHGVIAYGLGGITISPLHQRVVWQGVEQDYDFTPQPRHRRSVVLSVHVHEGRVAGVDLTPVHIGADGRPAVVAGFGGGARRVAHGLARVVWHLPGYALFYRAVLFGQFWFLPRWRALFSAHGMRKLKRLALRR
jgi:poly-gamma-glutamate synthesis protein (capsule biosynthesis protein)